MALVIFFGALLALKIFQMIVVAYLQKLAKRTKNDFDDTAIVDPASTAQAQSHLRLVVKDADPKRIAKAFTAPVVEAALASYPGMFPTAVPGSPAPFGVYWPTTVKRRHVVPEVSIDGQELP